MSVECCVVCGKEFPKVSQKKYCSEECAKEGKRRQNRLLAEERRNEIKIICPVCGKDFLKTRTRKYCSEECYAKNHAFIKRNYGIGQGTAVQKKHKINSAFLPILDFARKNGVSYGKAVIMMEEAKNDAGAKG